MDTLFHSEENQKKRSVQKPTLPNSFLPSPFHCMCSCTRFRNDQLFSPVCLSDDEGHTPARRTLFLPSFVCFGIAVARNWAINFPFLIKISIQPTDRGFYLSLSNPGSYKMELILALVGDRVLGPLCRTRPMGIDSTTTTTMDNVKWTISLNVTIFNPRRDCGKSATIRARLFPLQTNGQSGGD